MQHSKAQHSTVKHQSLNLVGWQNTSTYLRDNSHTARYKLQNKTEQNRTQHNRTHHNKTDKNIIQHARTEHTMKKQKKTKQFSTVEHSTKLCLRLVSWIPVPAWERRRHWPHRRTSCTYDPSPWGLAQASLFRLGSSSRTPFVDNSIFTIPTINIIQVVAVLTASLRAKLLLVILLYP